MRYVKSFLICFLIVFFANYLLPGIDVADQTKLPKIRGDLIFAAGLGLLNFLVYPLLGLFDGYLTKVRLAIVILILNFAAYAALKMLPLGIFIMSIQGYLFGALATSIACFILHYLQIRRHPSSTGSHFSGGSSL